METKMIMHWNIYTVDDFKKQTVAEREEMCKENRLYKLVPDAQILIDSLMDPNNDYLIDMYFIYLMCCV